MSADHSELVTTHIPTHHAADRAARRLAFRSIEMLERAIGWAAEQPTCIFGGYDENGDVMPEENPEPYEAVATFEEMVASNPGAVSILDARGRADLVQAVRPAETANAADDVPFGDEPRRYCNYQCQNCDRVVNREQPPEACTMCGCEDFQPIN
ncbi:hypothetical protein [Nitratireductor sp. XY-223]|uniref:hypothetical protein n=1 Tax=Nitratireductor sp. XY-223 TaxID=2561926 RepID=UPI0010AAB8D1|nr:hypothetical protein [Nitratireductor sp. XY-223]